MSKFGNVSKIIDAEKEQSESVERFGLCEACGTAVSTKFTKMKDFNVFYFDAKLDCPVCGLGIAMKVK